MTAVHVRTQEELDAALRNPEYTYSTHEIVIDSPKGVWLTINDSRGKDVQAYDSATVQAGGNATVQAYDSATVRAYDSATVQAGGNATVQAYDSATVQAWGSATVQAGGNATVQAWGSATVQAGGNATVRAGICVAVHIYSQRVTCQGGVIIDMTAIDQDDPQTWCAMNLVEVDNEGYAHLFKAVDDNLNAGHKFRRTRYEVGTVVDDTANWRPDNSCGGGLHVSPSPLQARAHYETATRFLEVTAPLASIRPIDSSKCKAPVLTVLREVDLWGKPVGGDAQ